MSPLEWYVMILTVCGMITAWALAIAATLGAVLLTPLGLFALWHRSGCFWFSNAVARI